MKIFNKGVVKYLLAYRSYRKTTVVRHFLQVTWRSPEWFTVICIDIICGSYITAELKSHR